MGNVVWAKLCVYRQARFIFLFIILVFAWVGLSNSRAAVPSVFREVNGLLVIEAEHFHSKTNTTHRDWYIFPTSSPTPKPDPDPPRDPSGVGGGKYVEILPDTRVTHSDPIEEGVSFFGTSGANAPRMNYRIKINSPGRYYVRARAYSTGIEDNSMHIGVNNTWPLSGRAMQWCGVWNAWQWSSHRRLPDNHCGDPNDPNTIYLDLVVGEHTLMIAMREDGFELDRFVLTKDPNYFPTGIGPAVTYAPPVIEVEPEVAVSVKVGQEVRLGVVAAGVEPLSYQWSKDGEELVGATGAELTLSWAVENDSGSYRVRVRDANGTVESGVSEVTAGRWGSVWAVVTGRAELSGLKEAVERAGLEGWLAGEAEVTLLAPSDQGIGSLAEGQWAGWLEDEEYVGALVRYHVLVEERLATEMETGEYETVNGAWVIVSWGDGGSMRVNEAEVIGRDLVAENGVVQVLDGVLVPRVPKRCLERSSRGGSAHRRFGPDRAGGGGASERSGQ